MMLSRDLAPASRDNLEYLIVKLGLSAFRPEILQSVCNSIFVGASREDLGKLGMGESRIGGAPDLPASMKWPEHNGKPLSFLAQIRLCDTAPHDRELLLPPSGYLYFFCNMEQSVWGFDPKDFGNWKVIFVNAETNLLRASAPASLPEPGTRGVCRLKFFPRLSLPEDPPFVRPGVQDPYCELRKEFVTSAPHHQLLGHPGDTRNEMAAQCQLVSHGIYCADPIAYQTPAAAKLKKWAKDWRLLFQVDSEEESEMMWGDLVRRYFWIRAEDLHQRNFTRVWMIVQCS
jgi:uncharacterized protein YwqG